MNWAKGAITAPYSQDSSSARRPDKCGRAASQSATCCSRALDSANSTTRGSRFTRIVTMPTSTSAAIAS